MPSNKAPGKDEVSTRVIKDCLPVILGPLSNINRLLTSSMFPEAWKEAEVIPLLKEGDHEVAFNNRPLSLLTFLSKVWEKVALSQFSTLLSKNTRLTSHQSGNKETSFLRDPDYVGWRHPLRNYGPEVYHGTHPVRLNNSLR